jgi:GT2 family glycosyltransferase
MFDEDLFLYIEDVDWAFRMRAHGKRSYTAFQARLWHGGASSSGGEDSPLAAYYFTRNVFVVTARHLPLRGVRGALRYCEILAMVIFGALRSRRPRASMRAVLAGWRDYRRGRLGPAPRAF